MTIKHHIMTVFFVTLTGTVFTAAVYDGASESKSSAAGADGEASAGAHDVIFKKGKVKNDLIEQFFSGACGETLLDQIDCFFERLSDLLFLNDALLHKFYHDKTFKDIKLSSTMYKRYVSLRNTESSASKGLEHFIDKSMGEWAARYRIQAARAKSDGLYNAGHNSENCHDMAYKFSFLKIYHSYLLTALDDVRCTLVPLGDNDFYSAYYNACYKLLEPDEEAPNRDAQLVFANDYQKRGLHGYSLCYKYMK